MKWYGYRIPDLSDVKLIDAGAHKPQKSNRIVRLNFIYYKPT
jgi:hypothetical protein